MKNYIADRECWPKDHIIVKHNGKTLFTEDASELPGWVYERLEEAYNIGFEDGSRPKPKPRKKRRKKKKKEKE